MLCHLTEHLVCRNQTAKGIFQHLTVLYLMIAYLTRWRKEMIRCIILGYYKNIIGIITNPMEKSVESQKKSELLRLHTHFPPFETGRATPEHIICLCGAFPVPPSAVSGSPSPLTPDGTSFNIQNPIPHLSQKEKVLLETRRAKECQR